MFDADYNSAAVLEEKGKKIKSKPSPFMLNVDFDIINQAMLGQSVLK